MTAEQTEPSADVWSGLPHTSRRQIDLERRIATWQGSGPLSPVFGWLGSEPRLAFSFDRPEIDWRGAGVGRPGLVAQLRWPRHRTRLALGVEVPIAHAVVDRLLGFDRPFAESRLQLTPVEWGVWTYLIVRSLEEINLPPGQKARALDLSIDRVSPDPFDVKGLGEIVTIRWAVRVGDVSGALRLWLPEALADLWLTAEAADQEPTPPSPKIREFSAEWRAVAGRVRLAKGLRTLRTGGVLPLVDPPLTGTPSDPIGPFALVCRTDDQGEYRIAATPKPGASCRAFLISGPLVHQPGTSPSSNLGNAPTMPPDAPPPADPLDAPVTLTVELGRINLPVSRLADLKPGDVLALNRHSREPVEITSNGRPVARGELILIDTELGVRVTSVFL